MNHIAFGLFKFIEMTDEEIIARLPSSIKEYHSYIKGFYEESTDEVYISLRNDVYTNDLPKILKNQLSYNRLLPLSKFVLEIEKVKSIIDNMDFVSVLSSKDILIYREIKSGELFIALSENPTEITSMLNPKTGNSLTYDEWKQYFH